MVTDNVTSLETRVGNRLRRCKESPTAAELMVDKPTRDGTQEKEKEASRHCLDLYHRIAGSASLAVVSVDRFFFLPLEVLVCVKANGVLRGRSDLFLALTLHAGLETVNKASYTSNSRRLPAESMH